MSDPLSITDAFVITFPFSSTVISSSLCSSVSCVHRNLPESLLLTCKGQAGALLVVLLLVSAVALVVGNRLGMSFAIKGRRETREAQMMAVYTSTIDQMIKSTSSPVAVIRTLNYTIKEAGISMNLQVTSVELAKVTMYFNLTMLVIQALSTDISFRSRPCMHGSSRGNSQRSQSKH
jgi:hypothetical protein